MAGIIPHGSRMHKLHLSLLKDEKKVVVPKRNNKDALEELMALSKEDLVATAELEEVEFHAADTKEVIAKAILEKRKLTE